MPERILKLAALAGSLALLAAAAGDREYARGVELQQHGDLKGARDAYLAALKVAPRRVDALSNLGLVYGGLGDYDEAIRTFEKALTLSPRQPVVEFNLALTYLQAEQFENARRRFADIVASQPDNAGAHRFLGLALLKLGKIREGIAELEIAEKAAPGDVELACTLASAYIQTKQLSQAKTLVEGVLSRSDTAPAHFIAGSYYMATRDYHQSLDHLKRAKELNPNLPDLETTLADGYAVTGSPDLAVAMFEKKLQANPLDYSANAFLGWLYVDAHRPAQARTYLERARRIKPDDPDLLFQLARLARMENKHEEAAELLERVIAARPNDTAAHVLLAQTYIKLKRKEEAARERATVNRLNAEEQRRRQGGDQ